MSASDFELFSRYLSYSPETGEFTWNIAPSIGTKAGSTAGSINHGYRRIKLRGRPYFAHRIALLLTEGDWPTNDVDHIDGDGTNNRLANLRHATRSENLQNQRRAHRGSHSGILGAYFHKRLRKWQSSIAVGGKTFHLGTFSTAEEAQACYLKAKRRFHSHCPDDLVRRLER